MSEKPFIHLFRIVDSCYLYDVNMDLILKISNDTYSKLMNTAESGEENTQIKRLKEAGFLKSNCVKVSEHPMTPFLGSFYKSKLNALTLQVTQNCNLRCDYCMYSGKYNTRTHSNQRMSLELARKGIDYLLRHSKESDELTLGFYGGEPLLEFDLIKKCVDYIQAKTPEKKKVYVITTNATLLNEEIVSFLVKYNFEITVSFDGPKRIHDKYRIFASSGEGSYNVVMDNVKYIRNTYPEFFATNVSFNTVLNPEEGYQCIGDFIKGEEVLKDAVFGASVVNDVGLKTEQHVNTNEFMEEYKYEYFKLLLSKMGKVHEENVSSLVKGAFSQILMMRGGKHTSGLDKLPEKWHHGGPCIPGQRTLFMNVKGVFYPCEKVCENADVAMLGDVWNGIDMQQAVKILNVETITENECKHCWAYRYCNFCIRYAEPDQSKYKENMLKRCTSMRKHVEQVFMDYCVLKELGYDFETLSIKGEGNEG